MAKPEKPYRVSLWLKFRRAMLRLIFKGVFAYLYRVKLTGMENIPKKGAYIIAYNHISVVEPPMILTYWPELRFFQANLWDSFKYFLASKRTFMEGIGEKQQDVYVPMPSSAPGASKTPAPFIAVAK